MRRRFFLAIGLLALLGLTLSIAKQPGHVTVKTIYRVYLPVIAKPVTFGMGLAWGSYREELNADWCYNSNGAGNCLSSNWDFRQAYDECPVAQLLGNEPDGHTGAGGYPTTPEEAVELSQQARATCPYTLFIAGNTMQGDQAGWLAEYVRLGGAYDILGTHCYTSEAQWCITALEAFRARFRERRLCLTEWGLSPSANRVNEFTTMLDYVRTWDCSAIYTDYAPPPWDVMNLLNPDGTPNALGEIYAER